MIRDIRRTTEKKIVTSQSKSYIEISRKFLNIFSYYKVLDIALETLLLKTTDVIFLKKEICRGKKRENCFNLFYSSLYTHTHTCKEHNLLKTTCHQQHLFKEQNRWKNKSRLTFWPLEWDQQDSFSPVSSSFILYEVSFNKYSITYFFIKIKFPL